VKELLRHSDTTPYITTLMGAAFRIAPNIPELAERVLNTLLSLEATLEILRSTMGGGPEENVLKTDF